MSRARSRAPLWIERSTLGARCNTRWSAGRSHNKHVGAPKRGDQAPHRRTHVVRIFRKGESCLRLVRALAVETHENWLEQHRYLNMDDLREHKKEVLRHAA